MSGYTASDLPNWLALQKAKNAADGIGNDNLLTIPAPGALPGWWDNPVGAERLNDTYVGLPHPDVSPVIGAYGAHPVTAAMRANALDIASLASQFGPADVASIRAYHGSPYDFHAFDTSKIGTGEGAQAYGHGLYFAENEGVAKGYRDNLTQTQRMVSPPTDAAHVHAAKSFIDAGYSPADTLTGLKQAYGGASDAELQAAYSEAAAPKGRMYEVSLNADPEHFLDWDAPLKDQHPVVQDALAAQGITDPYIGGKAAYDRIVAGIRPSGPRPASVSQAEASQTLRDAGIPGIKYLDQGSRSSGQGTSNFVIFDPATIEILRKYGIAGLLAGGGAAAVTNDNQ